MGVMAQVVKYLPTRQVFKGPEFKPQYHKKRRRRRRKKDSYNMHLFIF
jgi:hypothetical protein